MYNEITASSLVKVNMQGEVVEEGTTNFGVNQVRRNDLVWGILHQTCPVGFFLCAFLEQVLSLISSDSKTPIVVWGLYGDEEKKTKQVLVSESCCRFAHTSNLIFFRRVSFCILHCTKQDLTSSASSTFTRQTLLRWVAAGCDDHDEDVLVVGCNNAYHSALCLSSHGAM